MSSNSVDITSDRYSPLFPIYDEADIVVRSSDRILFATRKVFLQAASSVLDDVLTTGSEEVGEKRDGRAMLQLSEKGEELEPFLRLVQRDRFAVDGKGLKMGLPTLVQLSQLVERYGASSLSSIVFGSYLLRQLSLFQSSGAEMPSDVMSLLALAITHDELEVAQTIMKSLHHRYVFTISGQPGVSYAPTQVVPSQDGGIFRRHFGIEDVPDDLLERVPIRVIKELARLSRRVSDEKDYTWLNAAANFEL